MGKAEGSRKPIAKVAVGDLPDGALLKRVATRRDEAAFGALVRRYGPIILGLCRRVVGQEQDAEDAFQATFLVLFRQAGSIRNASRWGVGCTASPTASPGRPGQKRHDNRCGKLCYPISRRTSPPPGGCGRRSGSFSMKK